MNLFKSFGSLSHFFAIFPNLLKINIWAIEYLFVILNKLSYQCIRNDLNFYPDFYAAWNQCSKSAEMLNKKMDKKIHLKNFVSETKGNLPLDMWIVSAK